ncbi:MAG: hypothetical protein AB7U23_14500 [Dehalococcoidia bacterium]
MTFAVLLFLLMPPVASGPARCEPESPLAQLGSTELEVRHWEGTFGTYLQPAVGDRIVFDPSRLGRSGLVTVVPASGAGGAFPLDHLRVELDVRQGDEATGWTRRIVLKGRRSEMIAEKTVLELVLKRVVATSEVCDGRTVALTGNETSATLRIYSLRDDETIREYGSALAYHDLDAGTRIPSKPSR